MKICYFGTYEADYPRNKNIIKGLKDNGANVIELNYQIWKNKRHKINFNIFSKLILLLRYILANFILFIKAVFCKYDFLIIGYPGQFDMVAAFFLKVIKRKPLIFNPLLSLYDSIVIDRQIIKQNSLISKVLFLLDKFACKISDIILLDTNEHIKYFSKLFNINIQKFRRIWVGCDINTFYPKKIDKFKTFTVCFHGKFIPLQGVRYIVEAANILKDENIFFKLLGNGQEYPELFEYIKDNKLSKVELIDLWGPENISIFHLKSHISLGIFSPNPKASRVIPNKVFETSALCQPIISGESTAIKEFFYDKKNILFCKMGDADDLAKKILFLKNNKKIRNNIAKEAFNEVSNKANVDILGKEIYFILDNFSLSAN